MAYKFWLMPSLTLRYVSVKVINVSFKVINVSFKDKARVRLSRLSVSHEAKS